MTSTSSGSQDQVLRQAYAELAKAEKVGDYERCLKACSRILKISPTDVVANQCKLVTLIQLQKFDDALQTIRKIPALSNSCLFEKAYCEYRLNRSDEALRTLTENKEDLDFRCKELLAQLLYRVEKYEESYETYVDVLKNSEDDYDEERRANMAAVVSQLSGLKTKSASTYVPVVGTYEQCFNEGCRLTTLGQYENAQQFLQKAENMCRETLTEDELPEEEILDEVSCIRVQLAYCYQMMNNYDEAIKIYSDIIKQKPSDPTLLAIASNNFVSIKKESNLFDARKKMKVCQSHQLDLKLNANQRRVICFNNVLLNLHGNQFEPCRKGIEELRNKFAAFEEALLCEAALLFRQKDSSSAVDLLQKYIKEKGDNCSTGVHFALAQIYLNDGKLSQTLNVLNSLDKLKFKPGVLSLLVAINLANEDKQSALQNLSHAVDWLKDKKPDDPQLPVLVEECASLHARYNDFKTATKYLEDLRKLRPNDTNVLVRLINTYVQFDSKKAEEVSRALPPLGRLTHDLDVDALENASWAILGGKYVKKAKTAAEATPKIGDADLIAQKKKRKKKRKPQLPKKYDPNVPPDPERWLPKFERSTFKKRKDKRAKDRDIGRGDRKSTRLNSSH